MKKANAVVARNIINNDEVDAFCNDQVERYPALKVWITKVLRKWLIQKAPATKYTSTPQSGMPDWLRNAIENNTAESVVIDGALIDRLTPILDYLSSMIEEKANTDQTRISFDQAERGAEKWHASMAKRAEKNARRAAPIVEDGSKVVRTYPDGYYWVQVFGKQSMKREGDLMGHCVGRFNYFNENLAGRKEIYSLRDPDNGPHCTIEINKNKERVTIYQIKGKANLEVKDAYLPYVKDFLTKFKYHAVNFDQAKALRDEIHEFHKAKAWKGPHGTVIRPDIENYYGANETFIIDEGKTYGEQRRSAYDFGHLTERGAEDFTTYLLEFYPQFQPKPDYVYMYGAWNREPLAGNNKYAILTPANEFTHILAKAITKGDRKGVLIAHADSGGDVPIGSIGNGAIDLYIETLNQAVFDLLEVLPSVKHATVKVMGKPDAKLTDFYRHRHAGVNVASSESNKQTLNTFLEALRIPGVDAIAAAAKALSRKSVITDADFKSHGIPTGGNTTMAYSMVLVLSQLPRGVALPYLVSKPHAFRNWTEVMQNQMAPFLNRMKFSEGVKGRIQDILFNEYVRLLPTPAEIGGYAFNEVEVRSLENILQHVGNKRSVPSQSKQLWG